MAGIYIHIPFCRQACHYCDFHFSTNLKYRDRMTDCLAREMELRKDYLENEPVGTIYFGGGTPSLLPPGSVGMLLTRLKGLFEVEHSPEITLEANPDDLSPRKLDELLEAGINRLSIGLQTFDEKLLKFLNRAHDRQQALDCTRLAKSAGFENISVDLIHSIPDEPRDRLEKDLLILDSLQVPHVSTYCLTIEPQTVFGNWHQKGTLKATDEEQAADDYLRIMNHLAARGFDHYEISNYALPGYYSRHNTSYWEGKKYLGIGPGAHSFDQKNRHIAISNNARYMNGIEAGVPDMETDPLTDTDRMNEYVLVRIRTQWGVDLEILKSRFGLDLEKTHASYLSMMADNGLLYIKENKLRLTDKGKLLADQIAEDLFQVPEE